MKKETNYTFIKIRDLNAGCLKYLCYKNQKQAKKSLSEIKWNHKLLCDGGMQSSSFCQYYIADGLTAILFSNELFNDAILFENTLSNKYKDNDNAYNIFIKENFRF